MMKEPIKRIHDMVFIFFGELLNLTLSTNAAPLYNGNIAAMAVNIPQLGNPKVYNYHYDQLNCIVAMDAYNGLNPHTGTFSPFTWTISGSG